ncbi:hypothetical protein [Alistipes sp. ZOR0009]|uniref:hypothetical protein n=1 Tax=Alistipes sp. ZOR0009 TaxID=1339253 RepID=UPI000648352B|nr:hypothetical protein [Alistipes sp. ZOR0009]
MIGKLISSFGAHVLSKKEQVSIVGGKLLVPARQLCCCNELYTNNAGVLSIRGVVKKCCEMGWKYVDGDDEPTPPTYPPVLDLSE